MLRGQVEFEQAEHLPIAVLLDHVHPLVSGHKGVHFGRKGEGPQTHIVGFEPIFLLELIAALADREIRAAVSDQANFGFARSGLFPVQVPWCARYGISASRRSIRFW